MKQQKVLAALSRTFLGPLAAHVPSKPLLRLKGSQSTSGADCCDATREGGGQSGAGGGAGGAGGDVSSQRHTAEHLLSPITSLKWQK